MIQRFMLLPVPFDLDILGPDLVTRPNVPEDKVSSEPVPFVPTRKRRPAKTPVELMGEALRRLRPFVARKGHMPILSHVLIRSTKEKLVLTATDLCGAAEISLPPILDTGWGICLPLQTLHDVFKGYGRGLFSMKPDENGRLKISLGGSETELVGFPADEFPVLPKEDGKPFLKVPCQEWSLLVSQAAKVVSSDETRTALTGVCMRTSPKFPQKIQILATDSHRVHVFDLSQGAVLEQEWGPLLLPRTLYRSVAGLLKRLEGDLTVSRNRTHVFFDAPGLRFMGRLIEGKFPDIDQVVPKNFSRTVLAKAPELGLAIRRIQALALDRSSSIKVQVRPGGLEISAKTADVGTGKITVPAEFKGQPIEVSYNAKYLVEALALFRGPVQINISDQVGPTKLVGLPSEGWALVMPMRI